MNNKAKVFRNGVFAGYLIREDEKGYLFKYDSLYLNNLSLPAISLTLPKSRQEHHSKYLFPFFFNMLSEGINKKLQCRYFKIDEKDYFGLLLATAQNDTIGAVTVTPAEEE